jgi:hypothetical protein
MLAYIIEPLLIILFTIQFFYFAEMCYMMAMNGHIIDKLMIKKIFRCSYSGVGHHLA